MTRARDTRVAFRPDIEGLRAVAVGLVVGYHAGLPWLSGGYIGVDVFFVISGYLMTALILRELDATGRVSLGSFYARRIRRLLPASILVLVSTLTLAKLMLPPLALPDIARAGAATTLYVSNIWFAVQGTDYLAGEGASPLQHYWSLAVEEQFYLVWPVLLLIAFRVARGRWRLIGAGLAVLSVASLALCVEVTGVSRPWAFFSLPTRAWELGAGGLVAVAAVRLSPLPDRVARAAGWMGLGIITAAALLYDARTVFPGWAAIGPVLGTAAILLAGRRRLWGSVDVPLAARPMQAVGRRSYSLYLWHWPVLVLPAMVYEDVPRTARAGLVVLAAVLAWLTYWLVENPVRRSEWFRSRRRRTPLLAAALTAAGVLAAALTGVLPRLATDQHVAPLTAAQAGQPTPAPTVVPANVSPPLEHATDDNPVIYTNGCHGDFAAVAPPTCVFGEVDAPRTMMLAGDSHAAQWFPGLERLSKEDGWRLISLTKSACPSADVTLYSAVLGHDYDECRQWLDAVVARAAAERPDVVVLANWSVSYIDEMGHDGLRRWIDGLRSFIGRLPDGTRVVLLGDTPTWEGPSVNCLSANLRSPQACSESVAEIVNREIQSAEATLAGGRISYAPTYPWLCDAVCQALNRNVVVFRDAHHLTATMSALLVDRLREVIPPVAGARG